MRHSRTTERNPNVHDWSDRFQAKSNLEFFTAAAAELKKKRVGNEGLMTVGFVGQRDIPGHALRTAQSVLRWDLRPSLWSHVFLVAEPWNKDLKQTSILEIPLWPRTGLFPKPEWNGIGRASLAHYGEGSVDANVALVAVKMTAKEADVVLERARDYNFDRVRYSLWSMLGVWQGFLWSGGERPNPLREDIPIPSAAYVEMAFEAIGVDMTPMANTRNSGPEHIWHAAVWWHHAFRKLKHPISGYYVLRDKGGSLRSWDEEHRR